MALVSNFLQFKKEVLFFFRHQYKHKRSYVSTDLDDGVERQARRVAFVHEQQPGRCVSTCMYVLLGQAAVVEMQHKHRTCACM